MLILESHDAAADAQAFARAGIAASPVMRFEREGQRPDGSPVKVGFSLAFAEDRRAPEIHFATCQQHYPENFWNPEFQKHTNGARGIAGVTLVAAEPAAHRDMLLAFTGAEEAKPERDGFIIALPRGRIAVTTLADFRQRYGVAAPEVGTGARIAALQFDATEAVVVPPNEAFGATLLFSPAG